MKRLWLFVVILLASCMSTQDTPNVSLETLAQAQDAWVQKYFEPGSQVVRGAVQKDGSYMVTVTTEKGSVDTKLSNLPNFSSSQPRLSASNASSMALWALKGKRARALGATRAGLRPLDHLDWVSQYGVRNGQWHFTSVQMKTENKCYGIFNCGIESVQFKGTIGRSGVVAAWDRRDWNTAVGVWVSQKFADGVVVINGHNDLLFATSYLKGALSATARYKPTFLVSATQAGRQTSISRLMRGTRFFNLTAQRSYNFCSTSNAATDVGGGGPVCAPKPTKVSNGGCVSCAQYSGLIQQSQSALLDIENNQFVDRDGKLLEATGALTICAGALLAFDIPVVGPLIGGGGAIASCPAAGNKVWGAINADFTTWRKHNNWSRVKANAERDLKDCLKRNPRCNGTTGCKANVIYV